jgi:hypothetical protein
VSIAGGAVRLQNVALRDLTETALEARDAEVSLEGSEVLSIGAGREGAAIQVDGGSLEMRGVVLRDAGRRAIVVRGGRGLLQEVDARGSGLAALQAVDGAQVVVEGGRFARFGGAALYAGGARLSVHRTELSEAEYGLVAFRGAEIEFKDGLSSDTRVAAVALVRSQGVIDHCVLARGGSDAAISMTEGAGPLKLIGNRIVEPGPIGVHVTHATLQARGNTITGARLDGDRDLGDAIFAVDAEVTLDRDELRGNAGSGATLTRSRLDLARGRLIGNGRAGLVLLDRSSASARGSVFERNNGPALSMSERSRATLTGNRFGGNLEYDIDGICDGEGSLELQSGNSFLGPAAPRRPCK